MSDLGNEDIPVRRSNYVPPENDAPAEAEFVSDEQLASQIAAGLQDGVNIEQLISKLEGELGKREERKEDYERWAQQSVEQQEPVVVIPEPVIVGSEESPAVGAFESAEVPAVEAAVSKEIPVTQAQFSEGVVSEESPVEEEWHAEIAPEDTEGEELEILPVVDTVDSLISAAKVEAHLVKAPDTFIEHSGVTETAIHLRNGKAIRLFWLWFAPMSSIWVLIAGARLTTGTQDLWQMLIALLLGTGLSLIPVIVGTIASKWSGQPTMVVSRATFGHFGNILPALVAYLSRLAILLLFLWIISSASLPLLKLLPFGFEDSILRSIAAGAAILLAMIFALIGYKLIRLLSILFSITSIFGIGSLVYFTAPLLNFNRILDQPAGSWWATVGAAVFTFAIVGIIWSQGAGDLARYQRPSSSTSAAATSASLGFIIPIAGLCVWGIMLALSTPQFAERLGSDPFAALLELIPGWLQVSVLVSVILSLLIAITMAIYSAGLSLPATGIAIDRGTSTVLTMLLAAGGAVYVTWNQVVGMANLPAQLLLVLAVPTAAWAGLFSGEMFLRARRFDSYSLVHRGGVYKNFRSIPFVSLLLISGVGFAFIQSPIEWLGWLGYGYKIPGLTEIFPDIELSHIGVLLALILGILVSVSTSLKSIREQEMVRDSSLKIRN
ncbi:MAG: cytosine permease [Microbacteriaceae bacterium]|nr:cytosine permease [Microbacteriaceae bacterium]